MTAGGRANRLNRDRAPCHPRGTRTVPVCRSQPPPPHPGRQSQATRAHGRPNERPVLEVLTLRPFPCSPPSSRLQQNSNNPPPPHTRHDNTTQRNTRPRRDGQRTSSTSPLYDRLRNSRGNPNLAHSASLMWATRNLASIDASSMLANIANSATEEMGVGWGMARARQALSEAMACGHPTSSVFDPSPQIGHPTPPPFSCTP